MIVRVYDCVCVCVDRHVPHCVVDQTTLMGEGWFFFFLRGSWGSNSVCQAWMYEVFFMPSYLVSPVLCFLRHSLTEAKLDKLSLDCLFREAQRSSSLCVVSYPYPALPPPRQLRDWPHLRFHTCFYVGFWGSNLGPHACMASSWLSYHPKPSSGFFVCLET